MFDLIAEISQTLRQNRLRTFLTGGSVAWGIFMLIVLLGAARGVVNNFQSNMGAERNNTISLWGGFTNIPYRGLPQGRQVVLDDADTAAIRRSVAGVSSAVSTVEDNSVVISSATDAINGIAAIDPSTLSVGNMKLVAGRELNRRDMDEMRRVMYIADKNAELLFPGVALESIPGRTVTAMGLSWSIVGVYHHRWRSGSMVPYTTYAALTGFSSKPESITVTVEGLKTDEDARQAEADVRDVMARRHQFSPDDTNALWTWNKFSDYITTLTALGYLNWAVWIIGMFTLLSGIVGVSNIMFVSVRERTHEIGIRRAIGARPRAILTQILAESVTITTLFGYIGIVLGFAVLELIKYLLREAEDFNDPSVDLSVALQVTVALVVAGALAGLFPALKALKVKPVEALRDE